MTSLAKGIEMKKALLGLLLLAIVTALVFVACGDDEATSDATPGIKEVSVSMNDELAFDPGEVKVKLGEPVRLIIENSGRALHDFSVENIEADNVKAEGGVSSSGHGGDKHEYDLHLALNGGKSGALEFTPTEAGQFEFRCTEAGHSENGMTGKLIVS